MKIPSLHLSDLKTSVRPLTIAHRGFKARYPENTLVAFKGAIDAQAQMIELDVLLSKDRKLMVIHDTTLDRTTDGHGNVNDYTLAELKELDAGRWFDPRFSGERLPTLEEVLDLVGEQVLLNIEIKRGAYEPESPPDAIEKQVVALVRRKKLADSVLISSFEWRILENIERMKEPPPVALLSIHPDGDNHLEACLNLRAYSWHPSHLELRKSHVREMHEVGIMVFPYSADTPEAIERMLEMDVDGVITSDPLLLREYRSG
jgi:glycerophosphoryl diester phosphodiesterase